MTKNYKVIIHDSYNPTHSLKEELIHCEYDANVSLESNASDYFCPLAHEPLFIKTENDKIMKHIGYAIVTDRITNGSRVKVEHAFLTLDIGEINLLEQK